MIVAHRTGALSKFSVDMLGVIRYPVAMDRTTPEDVSHYVLLLDHYGQMLSEQGRELISLYYEENYSLAEIARHRSTSRQAVSQSLQTQRRQLEALEANLGLIARETHQRDIVMKLLELIPRNRLGRAKELLIDFWKEPSHGAV